MAKDSGKAHPKNRLTAAAVRKLGAGRYADGSGLYLEVKQSGARRWFLRTVVHGRRRDIGLGSTQLVTLSEAREEARRLRKVAKAGQDPIAERDRDKRRLFTFEQAARQVHETQIVPTARNPKHRADWISSLERLAFPVIGLVPVHAITQADLLRVLGPIWLETPETARRVRQRIGVVMDWAIATQHREASNPIAGIAKALPAQREKPQHFNALPWVEVPDLMKVLEKMDGMGALALRFTILTAARSGEIRKATWSEVDLEAGVWTRPAAHMKAGVEHRVPLAEPAVAVLRAVKAQERGCRPNDLIFESTRAGRPLSDMTLAAALKRAGVPSARGTVHGMRSAFRDWCSERTNFPREVAEAALAHTLPDRVEAAYARSDHFEKRRLVMGEWAAFCCGTIIDQHE